MYENIESNFSREEKLLWLILDELRKINLKGVGESPSALVDEIICKNCGKSHDNKGSILACAKKFKNGGV